MNLRTAGVLPAERSSSSLLGGGLIAGDSLAALSIGISALARTALGLRS